MMSDLKQKSILKSGGSAACTARGIGWVRKTKETNSKAEPWGWRMTKIEGKYREKRDFVHAW